MQPNSYSKPSSEAGFGMVEVLVSLLLILMAAAGGLGLLVSTMYSTQFAGQVQTASRLGQEVIDKAMTEPFALMGAPGSACASAQQTVYATGAAAAGGAGNRTPYLRSCQMSVLGNGMKLLRVTVFWNDAHGQMRPECGGTPCRAVNLGVQRAP